jgi:hypothetical protein
VEVFIETQSSLHVLTVDPHSRNLRGQIHEKSRPCEGTHKNTNSHFMFSKLTLTAGPCETKFMKKNRPCGGIYKNTIPLHARHLRGQIHEKQVCRGIQKKT